MNRTVSVLPVPNGSFVIENIEKYEYEVIDGNLKFTPKLLTCEELLRKYSYKKSSIEECNIINRDKIISTSTKYNRIMKDIMCIMDTHQILNNMGTTVKLTNENGLNGYNWDEKLRVSIRNKDADGTLKEIIKLVNLNNISIDLRIKLESGEIVHFRKIS